MSSRPDASSSDDEANLREPPARIEERKREEKPNSDTEGNQTRGVDVAPPQAPTTLSRDGSKPVDPDEQTLGGVAGVAAYPSRSAGPMGAHAGGVGAQMRNVASLNDGRGQNDFPAPLTDSDEESSSAVIPDVQPIKGTVPFVGGPGSQSNQAEPDDDDIPPFAELWNEYKRNRPRPPFDIPQFDGLCEATTVDVEKAQQGLVLLNAEHNLTTDKWTVDSISGGPVTVGFQNEFIYLAAGDDRDFYDLVAQLRSDDPTIVEMPDPPSAETVEQLIGELDIPSAWMRTEAADQLARWCKENPSHMSPLMAKGLGPAAECFRTDTDSAVVRCLLIAFLNLAKAGFACRPLDYLDAIDSNPALAESTGIKALRDEVRETSERLNFEGMGGRTFEEIMAEKRQRRQQSQPGVPEFDGICENALVVDAEAARANLLTLGAQENAGQYSLTSYFGYEITVAFQEQFMYLVAGDSRDFEDLVVQVRSDDPLNAIRPSPEPEPGAVNQVINMLEIDVPHYRLEAADQLARWTKEHPQHMSPLLAGAVRHLAREEDTAIARCILFALKNAVDGGAPFPGEIQVAPAVANDSEVIRLRSCISGEMQTD